uniref:hypothetical protein n=1 Tax=Escherichia coli TaxID=562 RepID=UPI001F3D6357|nr:hypothetical protein [Escherichia coli]
MLLGSVINADAAFVKIDKNKAINNSPAFLAFFFDEAAALFGVVESYTKAIKCTSTIFRSPAETGPIHHMGLVLRSSNSFHGHRIHCWWTVRLAAEKKLGKDDRHR